MPRFSSLRGLALAGSMLVALPFAALAQTSSPDYQRKLLRLSEILGTVHFLNRLCGGQGDQLWRQQMVRLLNAESPPAARRARLVNRFNRGYRGYQQAFGECTPAARVAQKRFLREGAFLSQSMTRDRAN